jgi:hypothetical protein
MEADMSRARRTTAGIALVALFVLPRAANAGIIDFIWEMSGPQMVGGGFACRWTGSDTMPQECRAGSALKLATGEPKEPWFKPPFYLGLAGNYHFSTGKNSGDIDYRFFRHHMFSLEPTVDIRSYERGQDFRLYQGGGLTFHYVFGVGHKPFIKPGFKLTPIAVEYKRWSAAVNVRLYPDGFTPDQFGKAPPLQSDRPREFTFGAGVSYILFRH